MKREIGVRTRAHKCEGCEDDPIVLVKTRAWLFLLCGPCLEEQVDELETDEEFEIDILPEK